MTKKLFNLENNPKLLSFLTDIEVVDNIDDADIVLFAGSTDVSPSLYGQKKGPTTITDYKKDLYEKKVYKHLRKNQLALGIGRGAQFLAVMNGAALFQDVRGHKLDCTHVIHNEKEYYEITSLHHQMVNIGTVDSSRLRLLFTGTGRAGIFEPEVFEFRNGPYANCLCIQGHPELMPDQPIAKVLNKLIHDLCE